MVLNNWFSIILKGMGKVQMQYGIQVIINNKDTVLGKHILATIPSGDDRKKSPPRLSYGYGYIS